MNELSTNEIKVTLRIFKDFVTRYNANNLSKKIGLSAMGTLKILNRLHKQNLLNIEHIGRTKIYSVNFKNNYAKQYIGFLLRKEAEESNGIIKRWIVELRKLEKSSAIGIMFGSVLRAGQYKDIDVLVVLKQSQLKSFNKKVEELNLINPKIVHPVKQTLLDLKRNLGKMDKVMLSAIKNGIVLYGYDKYIEVIESVQR